MLFTPITVRHLEIRNRLWVAPMCQYSATDGLPNDWHHVHLAQFASGGAGLVMAEATAVSAVGRISPDDVGIWTEEQAERWAPIAAAISARGATPAIQLGHAGRKASTLSPLIAGRASVPPSEGGWQTVAPSAIAYEGFDEPRSLTAGELREVRETFRLAAGRAVAAGFAVLEVHAAHGYLLHQFLSPLSNTRDDEYGGSLENRARLLLEIVDAIRADHPDVPLVVRFSATDGADGGWDVDQTVTVAGWVREHGADLADISSGGLVAHQRLASGPGYQVPYAARVRQEAGIATSAVGLITSGPQAEEILQAGSADVIMAAREWLRDPHFALRAAAELGDPASAPWPAQYQRAMR